MPYRRWGLPEAVLACAAGLCILVCAAPARAADPYAPAFRIVPHTRPWHDVEGNEIVERTGTSQSNISQHLEQLRNKNIVTSRKEANRIYYRIRNGKLLELIGTMRTVLCPTYLDDRYPGS